MNVLITGAAGFVGKNLCCALEAIKDGKDKTHPELSIGEIFRYDVDTEPARLDEYCARADFVIHLAGVNRPKDPADFMRGNFGFSSTLLETLSKYGNCCPIALASSAQASLIGRYTGSEYGKSKKAGEDLFFGYAQKEKVKVCVYRFPNVFGKWCKPNYNSAIATFCHNLTRGLPITVNDPSVEMDLVYIDDLIDELLRALGGKENKLDGFCYVPVHYETTLGVIAQTLQGFAGLRETLAVPDLSEPLTKKLYSTYLSYLPPENFAYTLPTKADERGSFTEILRTPDRGQFSVNVSKPGFTKGNHWHHTKNEKFLVVRGKGLIQLRKIGLDDEGKPYPVTDFYVSGDRMRVVEMIPGYTHKIINLSDSEDLVTVMWANECFDADRPDTYFEKV